MTVVEWVLIATVVASIGACLWWALQAIRKGHESGPVIDQLEEERDEAIEIAEDLAAPPLDGPQSVRVLRRLRDRWWPR